MSRHDDSVCLRQMLEHAQEAVELTRARKRQDLDDDRLFFLALLKLVEIVGEAANRVSEPTRQAHPELPWREMIGTRNRLAHGYDAVDCDILWSIATIDLPPLVKALEKALR